MKFLGTDEVKALVSDTLGADGFPEVPTANARSRRVSFEKGPGYSYFALAQSIIEDLGDFDWCVLWVVLTDVWRSNENLHLYYRLRESYGERSHVEERPAVLALRHETVDVVTFLHLGMLFGWEMYALTSRDDARAFISHDGWCEISESADSAKTADGADDESRPAT